MIRFKNMKISNRNAGVNLTPLIDIIFNLLIFFLITAVISTKGINLDLPKAATAEKMPRKSWIIEISKSEEIIFNGFKVDAKGLKAVLKAEKSKPEADQISSIIMRSDRAVHVGRFIEVMDTLRDEGFYNLVIATDIKRGKDKISCKAKMPFS